MPPFFAILGSLLSVKVSRLEHFEEKIILTLLIFQQIFLQIIPSDSSFQILQIFHIAGGFHMYSKIFLKPGGFLEASDLRGNSRYVTAGGRGRIVSDV